MLRIADGDDMDALLAIVARLLAARTGREADAGAWTAEAAACFDELELLFSLELFCVEEEATACRPRENPARQAMP